MIPRRRILTRLALLPLLLSTMAAAAGPGRPVPVIDVREPARSTPRGPRAVDPSFVRLSLAVPLRPMLEPVERGIPDRLGTGSRFEHEPEGFDARYEIRRLPFTFVARRDTLLVRADLEYRLTARAAGQPEVNCGSESAPSRGHVGCVTRLGWGDAWHLDARSLRLPTTYDRSCRPKLRDIDLTEFVNEKLAERMADPIAERVTSTIVANGLAPAAVDSAWRMLSTPIALGGDLWLDLGSQALLAGPLTVRGDTLLCELAVAVQPRLLGANRGSDPKPLPETRVRMFGDEFVAPFDCETTLDSLARTVRRSLAPADSPRRDVSLHVREVGLRANGSRLVVSLTLDGAASGRVHLLGTPSFDAASGVLAVPDLDWSPETATALHALAPDRTRRLRAELESLRAHTRAALRVDVGRDVTEVVAALGRALNQPLAAGAVLSGGIHERRVLGAYVTETSMGVRIAAAGTARLTVR